jgi:steroid 5-alpha reductase family enzyme
MKIAIYCVALALAIALSWLIPNPVIGYAVGVTALVAWFFALMFELAGDKND